MSGRESCAVLADRRAECREEDEAASLGCLHGVVRRHAFLIGSPSLSTVVRSNEADAVKFSFAAALPSTVSISRQPRLLCATQKVARDGVALLTVHSSKGLEFDVVIAGVAAYSRTTGLQARRSERRRRATRL